MIKLNIKIDYTKLWSPFITLKENDPLGLGTSCGRNGGGGCDIVGGGTNRAGGGGGGFDTSKDI